MQNRLSIYLRSLRSRNYRIFFVGQLLSLIGTWIGSVAMSWLVYRLTHSEFLLGVVSFATMFPSLLLAPMGGVLADRHDPRKILIATQAVFCVQSAVLAALVAADRITTPIIIVLGIVQGIIMGLDTPARQGLIPRLLEDRNDLPNAIALNSAMFNSARLLGPAIGGILLAISGEALCFTVDAVSFLAVIWAFVILEVPVPAWSEARRGMKHEMLEGLRYTFGHPVVRPLLLAVGLASFFGPTAILLLPVFVRDVFHLGPEYVGWLTASSGCGALLSSLFLASRKSSARLAGYVFSSLFLLAVALLSFSFVRTVHLAFPLLVLIGAAIVICTASANTLIQQAVEDSKRSRVMSFFFMVFLGTMPLGNLFLGALAEGLNASNALRCSGAALLLFSLLLAGKLGALDNAVRLGAADKA